VCVCYDKIEWTAKCGLYIWKETKPAISVVWKSAPCAIQMQLLKRKLVAFIG